MQGEALLVAGDLYEKSGATAQALAAYARYVEHFPRPIDAAIETRFKIAGFHQAAHDDALYLEELAQIVRLDAEAGPDRTSRTRTLAARSALILTEGLYRDFAAFELRQPFETSLVEKKRLMDESVDAFERLIDYEIGEVTAAATYYLAEIHIGFSRSLMSSERPAGMTDAELADYELALEEEAFPFEEQSIAIHEKNMELLRSGTHNSWTDKSLSRLAELLPVRYAKSELSSGFLGSIERYAYVMPPAPQSASTQPPAAEVPQTTAIEPEPQAEEVSLAGAL
jgi:tetratricopeptide (TPR) repeat protein